MAKFICHGIILEEAKRRTVGKGTDCLTIVMEERYVNSFKEVVQTVSIDFVGKASNCIPTDVRLAGCTAIVIGNLSSREYNGKYYVDLKGEELSIITQKSFTETLVPEQRDIEEARDKSIPAIDLPDDDLPF